MDKKQLITYAAIGVGLYLVYEYFLKDYLGGLLSPGSDGRTVSPVSQQPPITSTTGTTTNTQTQPPPPPPTSGSAGESTMERIPDETLHRQKLVSNAAYASKYGAGLTLGADQWNYYRQQLGLTFRDAGELPNRGPNLTIDQYMQWISTGSLSGLGYTYGRNLAHDFRWLQ